MVENSRLRILHVEDNPNDALLVEGLLAQGGVQCDITVVHSRPTFEDRLTTARYDLIMSDFSMPAFDGLSALRIAQATCPEVPFIFVSGAIGEVAAVESLQNGATDYVLKTNLARLPAAVTRAVQQAIERDRRLAAEAALREREQVFRSFMRHLPAVAFLKNADGKMIYCNERCEETFKLQAGQSHEFAIPPDYLEAVRASDERVLNGGQAIQVTEICPTSDGDTREWFVCKFPVDQNGERLIGGVAVDITEQRQLERNFLRAQRLESLGTLASGIAHDLNNVLLPISLGIEVLRDALKDKESEVVDMMQTSLTRASGIVKQVLTFTRGSGTEGEKILLNVGHIVRDVQRIGQSTLPRDISIRAEVERELWTVRADATQLHQVLLNLVVNARDAMPKGGTLTVSVRNLPAAEAKKMQPDLKAGDYVLLEVADTGTGIPPEHREKVFEPFFTSKEVGKGTGLGLATCFGIVENHQGTIDFETEMGKGTTFRVLLPAAGEHVADLPVQHAPAMELGGGEVVLIIDDEAAVRELTKLVLGHRAYQVVTAENGVEGLNTFRRLKDRIDLVIVDANMPLSSGAETVRGIRELRPDMRIIAVTGQPTPGTLESFRDVGVDCILEKPYPAEKLLAAVSELLRTRVRVTGAS
jgi:two-component system, cell cycle sensor histidine kinase and response regulator CckA